jgi:hypothetical protein
MPAISENHRRIDVNAAKNPAVHRDKGPLGLAATVLASCPLRDTIAILIVLLQIPPTFLSIVHLLFATLTFVPPSTSASSGISFSDIFGGTIGTPSLATIVFVDLAVFFIWLFLSNPLQDIVLDLAQTVIALTLGGGTSGREAGMNNVLVCFGIIGFSHLVRNGSVKQSGLRAFISSSTNGILASPDPDDPLEPTSHSSSKKGAHTWIRNMFAIHILTQGVVRYIRDWYVRREKRDNPTSLLDPEAGKIQTDGNSDTSTHTPENESSNLPINSINTKKKKKQSALVRWRQPLWAAIASTKIVVVKEYETSHTAAESAGTNATDINNLGDAPFRTEPDRIWITYVGSDEVLFETSYFPTHNPQENCDENKGPDSLETDKSKPFYVRVNDTIWRPTKIYTTIDPDQPSGQDARWSGEIFGLTPMSSYNCEFISTTDDSVIFSTSVRTTQPPVDVAATLCAGPVVTDRPGSPTTTWKSAIATSEVKLAEEKSRRQKERAEQKKKLSAIRADIDKLASRISSAGGTDDRDRRREKQLHVQTKQYELAAAAAIAQIEDVSNLSTDAEAEEMAQKSEFQAQKDIHKKEREEYEAVKRQADEEMRNLTSELNKIEQKVKHLDDRKSKLRNDLAGILDANSRGLDERQRRIAEQQAKEAERKILEAQYHARFVEIDTELQQKAFELSQLHPIIQQLQAIEQADIQYNHSPTTSVPNLGYGEIPESSTASNYPWNPSPNTSHFASPYAMIPSGSKQGQRTRGRSSSMLSNVSGFTQSSSEVEPQQLQTGYNRSSPGNASPSFYLRDMHGSSESASGSGSGGGSGNVSAGDSKSPRDGNVHSKSKSGSGGTAAGDGEVTRNKDVSK